MRTFMVIAGAAASSLFWFAAFVIANDQLAVALGLCIAAAVSFSAAVRGSE